MTPQLPTYFDAIVIGSGHNGLVAAAYLAQAGRSVLVVEKNTSFGGATASQRVFPDYDALLSRYSYLISLFPNKIIDELGLEFATRRRATASFTPWQDGLGRERGLIISNRDPQRSRDSLYQLTGQHTAWDRYNEFLTLQSTLAKLVWPTLLEPLRSRKSFEAQLQNEVQRLAWRSFVERPVGEAIEKYADHDALRGLLLTDGKIGVFTHAHDPSLLQNRCFLYHVIGNETGEWRVPVGGMKSLVDTLLGRCRSLGVTLLADTPARHIALGADLHEVTVEINGVERSFQTKDVLINAGPTTFSRLLQQAGQSHPEDEGSVIKINMLLERLPKLKAHGISATEAFTGSFHIDESYSQLESSYRQAAQGEIPRPAPGEVYCHTLTDVSILSQDLQQRGFHTLTLFGLDMPWRVFETDHEVRKAQVLELYLQGLDRLCAESFRECLAKDATGRLCVEIKTPQDLQAEVDLDRGNIFHNSPSWFYGEGEEIGTWGVETVFPRIYRAGSSAIRGGAVSGIPGRNAAMCILNQS